MSKCKVCKSEYVKRSMSHVVCGIACAKEHAKTVIKKIERKADKATREKLKSRSQWIKETQTVVNAFIRARDKGQPCISCQRHHQGQIHAGHYRSTGSSPALRFDEANIHAQCQPCNTHLSGNLIPYRVNLIAKIGIDEVERLEGPQEPKKYSIEQLQHLIQTYRAKLREIK